MEITIGGVHLVDSSGTKFGNLQERKNNKI
jgi:hypothetical protein